MWQTHTHTHKTSSPLWLRQAGNCQRKDEIFWLVTLSRLFLSVLPKMPTFVALWGTDRMPACDWETMGYMHTLKTSEKLCKAHEDQCFLNRDPRRVGGEPQPVQGSHVHPTPILRITVCNKGAQFVVLRCIRKGCEDQGKWLRMWSRWKSICFIYRCIRPPDVTWRAFPTAPGISPDLILHPKTSPLPSVFLHMSSF